ncbi:PTS sugar transporter subunit IIA [candidate division KSB1 bacterium]|nr:PTS sugar transporter subunit IIA [candidate division KSB1 bacterium]
MRLGNYLDENLIILDLVAEDKKEAIQKIVHEMKKSKKVINGDQFYNDVMTREGLGSTGIGIGIALPHARSESVESIVVSFARLKKSVDFGSPDKKPVRIVMLLGTCLKTVGEYLKVLSKISKILRRKDVVDRLLKADTAGQIISIFNEADDLPV